MKLMWTNDKLTVTLHKQDRITLDNARAIGAALVAVGDPAGKPLVEAIQQVLKTEPE